MIDLFLELIVIRIGNRFQDILNLLQMIAIVVAIVIHVVEGGIHFQADYVASIELRVDRSFAAIARVVDHVEVPISMNRLHLARRTRSFFLHPSDWTKCEASQTSPVFFEKLAVVGNLARANAVPMKFPGNLKNTLPTDYQPGAIGL
jgi:hypothetical protein